MQPWSSGKVGLNGISYYGINQWHVASLQPPHLAAMCIWEGVGRLVPRHDPSRRHSVDVLGTTGTTCRSRRCSTASANAASAAASTASSCAGPRLLSEEQLAKNRSDFGSDIRAHPLDDTYHRERSADWSKITVPFLSAANWGGQGLHPRGNFEGFTRAASKQKWLEVHGIEHWTHFYTDYGRELQLAFFDHFLHGKNNGWDTQPKVQLQVRHPGEKFVRAQRERMADRAHEMDEALSRSGRRARSTKSARRTRRR